jgi:hypothetical protein
MEKERFRTEDCRETAEGGKVMVVGDKFKFWWRLLVGKLWITELMKWGSFGAGGAAVCTVMM